MIISQLEYVAGQWHDVNAKNHSDKKKLILLFGDRYSLEDQFGIDSIKAKFPNSEIVSVSTSGDFLETALTAESDISASVIEFEKSEFKIQKLKSSDYLDGKKLGSDIAKAIDSNNLEHVILFSEGTGVNGSLIIEGLNQVFRGKVTLTGGLAGDANRFQKTLVGVDEDISHDNVVAIGLYGTSLKIGFGNECGFESFGPLRKITKSSSNLLYEIDNKPALWLYKEYLGKHAEELPESALWFPLEISTDDDSEKFVRTILNINEEDNSMTFAGNVPEGSYIRLMRSNTQEILASAESSAINSNIRTPESEGLALLISCVGRRSILKERTEEELEEVRDILPESMVMTGFYSYGEMSTNDHKKGCELYNQTLTITTICED